MGLYNLWALLSSFFYLEVFQIPPCTCQHLIFTYWQMRVHGIATAQFVSPLLSDGHLSSWMFVLSDCNAQCCNKLEPKSVWTNVFILLNIYLYRSGVAGSWENSMVNLSRNRYLFSKLAFWTLQESQHTCFQARHTESNSTETAVLLTL